MGTRICRSAGLDAEPGSIVSCGGCCRRNAAGSRVIAWIWTPSERRIFQFSYPLGIAGFLILTDHAPRDAQIIGALAIGILLGIGVGLIPWKTTEARPYWRVDLSLPY
ncbi:MAG: hypothetical protein R2849_21455 [Thermomicrobiales bacterium]